MASSPEYTVICNGAICLLGAGLDNATQIDDYDSDTGTLIDWCRRRLPLSIQRALWLWPWEEARLLKAGTDAGGDVTSVVHPGYDYAYAIPTAQGALALRGIVDEDCNPLKYKRVGAHIHTDYTTSEFWWDYIANLTSGFSVGLTRCIEYELATDLAGVIYHGEDTQKKRLQLIKEYRELILPDARRQSQSQQYDRINVELDTPICDIT